jgi:hypothetical protein
LANPVAHAEAIQMRAVHFMNCELAGNNQAQRAFHVAKVDQVGRNVKR